MYPFRWRGERASARFRRTPCGRQSERARPKAPCLLCSFQKEESVLIDELLRVSDGRPDALRIVTIDTGVLFEETLQTWRRFEERFGVQDRGRGREQSGRTVDRAGALLLDGEGRRARARARRALRPGSPAFAASRARRGRTTELIELDEGRGIWKYNPLAHWTDRDLWRRIHERDLPYNPLHDQGYESIGCAPCTLPGSGREGRWAGTEKTECGLHVESRLTMSVAAPTQLSHLRALESESIHVMREVAAEFERPVLLFSGGKDSIVLLRLAEKAFRPAPFPFPLMHVDTGHNFPEVIEFRDRRVAELGERLIVASVQDSIDSGRVVEETGPRASRNRLQTVTLLDAIAEHGFDAAFGGARRDEERARAKERVFSFRDDFGQWDPKNQRPELWNLYNGRIRRGEHVRVFPLSNWTELDVWEYIDQRAAGGPLDLLRARARGLRARRHALRRGARAPS